MGWGILICVPALFFTAWLMGDALEKVPLCAVRAFLRFDCPGCGLTRSFVALTQGRFRAGIGAHPLGIIAGVWLCYFFARHALAAVTGRNFKTLLSQKGRDIILMGFLAGMFLHWLAKLLI